MNVVDNEELAYAKHGKIQWIDMYWHTQPWVSCRGHSRSYISWPTQRSCETLYRQLTITLALFRSVSEILRVLSVSVCLSVMMNYNYYQIGWNTSKIISRLISRRCSRHQCHESTPKKTPWKFSRIDVGYRKMAFGIQTLNIFNISETQQSRPHQKIVNRTKSRTIS